MIESLHISDIYPYKYAPQMLPKLAKINFIFGSNGVGKTTVSKLMANAVAYPTCAVNWKGGVRLEVMVYNRDFIEYNFNQSDELKGVFTLGKENLTILAKIDETKKELDGINKKIVKYNSLLKGDGDSVGKESELESLEKDLEKICWMQKQKYDEKFQYAFTGVRSSVANFKVRVLKELIGNSSELQELAELEKKYVTVFSQSPVVKKVVVQPERDRVLRHEANPILRKCVIGKDDVDIAAMIKKLGNSDWVKEGRSFYNENEKICPFCQQDTADSFMQSLSEYFDEVFEGDGRAIDDLLKNYIHDSACLLQELTLIVDAPSQLLDIEKLKNEKELLESKIGINLQRIKGKNKEPSQSIELESLQAGLNEVKEIIDTANGRITEHNLIVANLEKERNTLISQVWKYLLEVELKANLESYTKKKGELTKAIDNITEQLKAVIVKCKEKTAELKILETQTTSTRPTIDGINNLLSSFGFHSFSLALAGNGNFYKLVRADGTDAKTTLSEGEKSFITFLYFYYLLKGSNSESGMTIDRIVVFDDPVSSLDSDVLFIVSSLIKGVFEEARSDVGTLKQIFVLTHNVYFHKEVSFNKNRSGDKVLSDETFWVIRKSGYASTIERHNSNPVKTSYELLWSEIRRAVLQKDYSNLTMQNTLRRILEHYFKILGSVDLDKLCANFEDKERLVCKSLLAWVNSGSHYAFDGLHMPDSTCSNESYLKIFQEIFKRSGHEAHYNMMMGEEPTI